MGEFEANSNKRANASHYVRGLRYYVETFEEANLKTTANWLALWIDEITSDHPPSLSEYEKAYAEFRSELKKTFEISPNVLAELERLLSYPKKPTQKAIQQAASFLNDLKTKVKIVNKILLAFRQGNLDQEQLFYGDCFVYLILMEGVFDAVLSMLYAWSEASAGRGVEREDIEIARQSLRLLHDSHGVQSLQEEYWEDKGHLRNSIAHARFSYDPKGGGHFLDSYKGRVTYDQMISSDDLNQKVTALFDLAVCVLVLLIMRISLRGALLDLGQWA
jgi:hypothetical protein